jgi:hypothetical protein
VAIKVVVNLSVVRAWERCGKPFKIDRGKPFLWQKCGKGVVNPFPGKYAVEMTIKGLPRSILKGVPHLYHTLTAKMFTTKRFTSTFATKRLAEKNT